MEAEGEGSKYKNGEGGTVSFPTEDLMPGFVHVWGKQNLGVISGRKIILPE